MRRRHSLVPTHSQSPLDVGKKQAALVSALDALHPIILAQMKYPEKVRRADREKYQATITKQVTSCDACNLRKKQPKGCKPIPFTLPKKQPKFAVIGEAPGMRDEQGKPMVGAAGQLLRVLMTEAGIDPYKDVAWVNSISCVPMADRKTLRKGKPTKEELTACRDNMLSQVFASYTPYVLLVGASAFTTFRSDLNVTNHHGRFFVLLDTFVTMGLIHPASALDGSNAYKKSIRDDLKRWHDVVYGDDNPLLFLGETCAKCDGIAVTWDRDGAPWCQKHEKLSKQWEKERDKWLGPRALQLEIF